MTVYTTHLRCAPSTVQLWMEKETHHIPKKHKWWLPGITNLRACQSTWCSGWKRYNDRVAESCQTGLPNCSLLLETHGEMPSLPSCPIECRVNSAIGSMDLVCVCVHVTCIWYNKTTTTGFDNVASLFFSRPSTALGTCIELVASVALAGKWMRWATNNVHVGQEIVNVWPQQSALHL